MTNKHSTYIRRKTIRYLVEDCERETVRRKIEIDVQIELQCFRERIRFLTESDSNHDDFNVTKRKSSRRTFIAYETLKFVSVQSVFSFVRFFRFFVFFFVFYFICAKYMIFLCMQNDIFFENCRFHKKYRFNWKWNRSSFYNIHSMN